MRSIKYLFILSAMWMVGNAMAQNYSIDWYKVAGGSGASSNGQYSLTGTIGQHDAGGPMANGSFSLTGGFWSLFTVQTPGATTLFIMKSVTNAVLYWPTTGSSGYLLESNPNLQAPGGWATVAPTPVVVGGFNYVTNQIVPGRTYYRLRHP